MHTTHGSQSISRILDLRKAIGPHALEMNFKGTFLDEGRRVLN